MKMNEILESSGWKHKENEEGLEYEIPLSDVRFYYEEEGAEAKLYTKRKYRNSTLWGSKKHVMSGPKEEVGEHLAKNGLLNEREFTVKKDKYIKEKIEEEKLIQKRLKEERMSNAQRLLLNIGNNLINATKKIALASVIIVGGYTSYHYVNNKVDPASLYTYIKDNIGNYDFKDIVANEAMAGLTYTQIRNVDYAIENNQVEELLETVRDVPENINYISVLKENIAKSNN